MRKDVIMREMGKKKGHGGPGRASKRHRTAARQTGVDASLLRRSALRERITAALQKYRTRIDAPPTLGNEAISDVGRCFLYRDVTADGRGSLILFDKRKRLRHRNGLDRGIGFDSFQVARHNF
jgi:hypothetical protein